MKSIFFDEQLTLLKNIQMPKETNLKGELTNFYSTFLL